MQKDSTDKGVILTLLDRFNKQRLPRALEMQKKVNTGELLSENDHSFLEEVLADAHKIQSLVGKYPEYQEIYVKAVTLWKEIIDKEMENQKKSLK